MRVSSAYIAPIAAGVSGSLPAAAWLAACDDGVRESERRASESTTAVPVMAVGEMPVAGAAPMSLRESTTSSNVPCAFSLGTLMSFRAIA